MMFGRYALPSDDLAQTATSVTPSAEMDGYPGLNLVGYTASGHLNLPSRPAKLDATSGYFDLAFGSAITVRAAALIYHNLDAGLNVTIVGGGGAFTQAITIPAKPDPDDDWTISPWVEFASAQTYNTWRLSINAANSEDVRVGRLLLLGQLRQLDTDVRYGGELAEDRLILKDQTVLGIENIYDMYGVRRRFAGEFGFRDSETADLLALWRSARTRVLPWLLIPDEDVNDAWFVRFEDDAYSRTMETIGFNSHPYRVREVARGMPWP